MPRSFHCIACSLLLVSAPVAAAARQPAAANEQRREKIECSDVALTKEGELFGQLTNGDSKPIAGAKVWLLDGRREPVSAHTNESGRFGFKQLRPGVYSVQTGDAARVCRVWNAKSAPPKSISGVLLVADEGAVRGQFGPPPLLNGFVQHSKKFFAHPVGMVAIGAAIAAPIAIIAADDDDPASP